MQGLSTAVNAVRHLRPQASPGTSDVPHPLQAGRAVQVTSQPASERPVLGAVRTAFAFTRVTRLHLRNDHRKLLADHFEDCDACVSERRSGAPEVVRLALTRFGKQLCHLTRQHQVLIFTNDATPDSAVRLQPVDGPRRGLSWIVVQ